MKRTIIGCCTLFFILMSWRLTLGQVNGQTGPSCEIIPLQGIWKFKLDPFFTGISSNGVQLMPQLPEEITLPGSTDQAGKGIKTQDMTSLRLTRLYEYKGAAWYEKEIFVPSGWKNKDVRLFLERAHWETSVWVNGQPAGKQESLSTPHVYDLAGLLQPGKKNVIRIRVDNNMIYNIEYSHAVSAETQTNWNGIIGRMELQAYDKVHLEDIQVYPQLSQKSVRFQITILNRSKAPTKGILHFSGNTANTGQPLLLPTHSIPFSGSDSLLTVSTEMALGAKVQSWDEFDPVLYQITVSMTAEQEGMKGQDNRQVVFGMRELATAGTRFTINGRPTFIRGTVNSAEFPVTGYPPMEPAQWERIFTICKEYGLNAMRFHSWCPPEAAFVAADKLGMYLQVENSDWRFTIGKDSAVNRFLTEEADRILRTYGNHPSFMMFCEGNELVGPSVNAFLSGLVSRWKKDPRHLYTSASAYPVVPENQYNVFYGARPQRWKEGLKGRFNVQPLNTRYDYADYVAKFRIPMITHEIGQWCVYPDYNEIPKYNGVLKPYNYELFRESLREHHMIDLAEKFTLASGKFQVLQKKEEIESYLRTPGFGGYHLLQLNDFPGQGTAPVGVVDVFWDPKKYVTAKEFSRFQGPVVPLLRTDSFTYTNDQHFKATIQFANFGKGPVPSASIEWSLQYEDGKVYQQGKFKKEIALGSPVPVGEVVIPLNKITVASRLIFTVQVAGTAYSNQWSIWVYPQSLPAVSMNDILVTGDWNEATKAHLRQGGKVLLLADTGRIHSTADPVFSGISWNTVWSGMPPNLLGILCDPAHPALKHFPTECHSNWQWWDVVRHSKPVVLDAMPASFRPLVQMIPDWNNNKKIGLIWEAKIGKGQLLFSAVDLINGMEQRPVASQLLYSLKRYIVSEDFNPAEALAEEIVDALFRR
ncbi:sugar-binding domain-containing protein [Longitalea luteola]|uniref:sugar-binding domain-containing protein n=1 Tax=Longitalea luteola TaxID=2812563 RepID=UPI001F61AC8E|nr:sugar-binding domain-containing protein [Longitalea luteola]